MATQSMPRLAACLSMRRPAPPNTENQMNPYSTGPVQTLTRHDSFCAPWIQLKSSHSWCELANRKSPQNFSIPPQQRPLSPRASNVRYKAQTQAAPTHLGVHNATRSCYTTSTPACAQYKLPRTEHRTGDDLPHSPASGDFGDEHSNKRRPGDPPAPVEDRPVIHPRSVSAGLVGGCRGDVDVVHAAPSIFGCGHDDIAIGAAPVKAEGLCNTTTRLVL